MEGETEVKKKKYPVHEGYVDINKLKLVNIKKFLQEIKKKERRANGQRSFYRKNERNNDT